MEKAPWGATKPNHKDSAGGSQRNQYSDLIHSPLHFLSQLLTFCWYHLVVELNQVPPGAQSRCKKKKKGDDIIWRFEWRLFRALIISGSVCIICRTKTQMITRQFSVEAAPLGECGLGRNWGILEFLISLSFTMLC